MAAVFSQDTWLELSDFITSCGIQTTRCRDVIGSDATHKEGKNARALAFFGSRTFASRLNRHCLWLRR